MTVSFFYKIPRRYSCWAGIHVRRFLARSPSLPFPPELLVQSPPSFPLAGAAKVTRQAGLDEVEVPGAAGALFKVNDSPPCQDDIACFLPAFLVPPPGNLISADFDGVRRSSSKNLAHRFPSTGLTESARAHRASPLSFAPACPRRLDP